MAKSHIKYILAALLLPIVSLCTMLANVNSVYADDEKEERPAILLQVSPPKVQLGELKPGTKAEGSFTVQNAGTEKFDYKIYTTPYQVTDQNYTPSYDGHNNYTQITNWFTFSQKEGHLEAGKEQEITFTVNVPKDAPDGGQYAAVMVETDSGNSDNATIKAVSRIGMIVYSHVGGTTNACGKLVEQGISGFLLEPPITATSIVENCGNVDLEATYTLQVFPLFSDEEIYTTEENPETRATLPETKRFNKLTWNESPSIGIYRVKQTIKYAGENYELEKMVVICPLWVIILIIVFIGAVVFFLVSRSRGRKTNKAEN